MSQYFSAVFFPSLPPNEEGVRALIDSLFASVKELIPLSDYVLDLMIDFENKRALVIEINPFGKPDGMGTGKKRMDSVI